MDDDPPHGVEFLDEWDSRRGPRPARAGRGRILALSAGVLVVALAIAVSLGAMQRRAAAPVTSSSTTPTASPTLTAPPTRTVESTYQVSGETPSAYATSLPEDPPVYTPDPIPTDLESIPLTFKLLDNRRVSANTVAYRVSVCVNSAAVGGGKVRIRRDYWELGTSTVGPSGPTNDSVPVEPAFPVQGLYGKGQCATGYVTFWVGSETPTYIGYENERSSWLWRLS